MLINTWVSPALLSFLPIFIGWYTTEEHKNYVKRHPDRCEFIVNKPYCVISSSISFWIPCTIMIFTYLAIFREANRQEKQMMARQGNAMLMHRHSEDARASVGVSNNTGMPKSLQLLPANLKTKTSFKNSSRATSFRNSVEYVRLYKLQIQSNAHI